MGITGTSQRKRADRRASDGTASSPGQITGGSAIEATRGQLVRLLEQRISADGLHDTQIPQLKLYRFSNPTEPLEVLAEAAVYVVVQGRKQLLVGGKQYIYDPTQYLAVSVDMPAVGNVLEAAPGEPY